MGQQLTDEEQILWDLSAVFPTFSIVQAITWDKQPTAELQKVELNTCHLNLSSCWNTSSALLKDTLPTQLTRDWYRKPDGDCDRAAAEAKQGRWKSGGQSSRAAMCRQELQAVSTTAH